MSQPVFFAKEPTTSSLLMCRGCLTTDARLYTMQENRLMEAYSKLIPESDDLPHYLCNHCAVLLLKCEAFRDKCVNAQRLFRNTKLNTHQTEQTDRQTNIPTLPYKKAETFIINIDPNETDSNVVKIEIDIKNEYEESMKVESNVKNEISISEYVDPLEDDKDHDTSIKKDDDDTSDDSIDSNDNLSKLKPKRKQENTQKKRKPKDNKTNKLTYKELVLLNADLELLKASIISNAKYKNVEHMALEESMDLDREEHVHIKKPVTKIRKSKTINYDKFCNQFHVNVKLLTTTEEQSTYYQGILNTRKESDNYKLGAFKCDICYKGFVYEEVHNKHMFLHSEKAGNIVCEICKLRFNNKRVFQRHRYNHTQIFSCKKCDFSINATNRVRDHHRRHVGLTFSCKHCEKQFICSSSYYGHLKLSHPTSDELIRCEMCGDSLFGPLGIKRHERLTHPEMKSPECHCSGCDTQFYCSSALKVHQGAAGLCDPRAKFCVRCGRSFETEQLLREHEAEQRKPRDEFECEVCKKKFLNFTYLNCHRRIHDPNNSRTYKQKNDRYKKSCMCEICGSIFTNEGLLTLHQRVSHLNWKPYTCSFCPKSFKTSITLKIHTCTHTGERPFQCELCPKAFQSFENLKRHGRIHTGERPYLCHVCGKNFRSQGCVKTHIQTVHMRIPMPPRIRRRIKKTE